MNNIEKTSCELIIQEIDKKGFFNLKTNQMTTEKKIQNTVETYFKTDLSIKSSLREYVYPKSILCYLLRQKTPLSIREIKSQLGYKSNQVILYHIQSVEANKKINKFLRKDLEEIEKLLTL